MRAPLPVVVLILTTFLALPALGAPTGTDSQSYTYGLAALEGNCGAPNHGGACFTVPPGTIAANVRVLDENRLFRGTDALVTHYMGDKVYASWHICEDWQWLGVPPGVTTVRFDLQDIATTLACGPNTPATQGTIVVTWYDGN